jgi:hypothetical protein
MDPAQSLGSNLLFAWGKRGEKGEEGGKRSGRNQNIRPTFFFCLPLIFVYLFSAICKKFKRLEKNWIETNTLIMSK